MQLIKLIFLGSIYMLVLSSCKKKSTDLLTTKDGVVGSWKLRLQGEDVNNNGTFDTDEKNEVPDSLQFSYQFFKEGTGYKVGYNNTYVDSLYWELQNNEKTIFIKISNNNFIFKSYYQFEYNNKSLTLKDTSVKPMYIRFFEREN